MTVSTWTLVDPVAPIERPGERGGWAGTTAITRLGFLSNRKPNTAELQRALADRISARYPDLEIVFFEKASAAAGAGETIITSVMKEVELLVNGTGD